VGGGKIFAVTLDNQVAHKKLSQNDTASLADNFVNLGHTVDSAIRQFWKWLASNGQWSVIMLHTTFT